MNTTRQSRLALVAGAGPGLGRALVAQFAAEGLDVVAVSRRASQAPHLKEIQGPGRVIPRDVDVTDVGQVTQLFDWMASEGPLELAVFNAGVLRLGRVVDVTPEDFEHCWRTGCLGGLLVGQGAARLMQEQGHGSIIFTGATASLRGGAGFVNLASPKFALRAVAQSMARELGPEGIHVAHVIIDGQIRSERYEDLLRERGPDALLEPQAIATHYWQLHCQPRSAWTHELDLRPWVETF